MFGSCLRTLAVILFQIFASLLVIVITFKCFFMCELRLYIALNRTNKVSRTADVVWNCPWWQIVRLQSLPPHVAGPSRAVELKGDQWGACPEHAWLIPDSIADSSSDRQIRAQPVIDHCLVVLPTKELVVLCLCRSVFVLGYGVAMS